jgi:ubiquinone/menaquinone biosynthesis C-methylase UbiE
MKPSQNSYVLHNKLIHDAVADQYERIHTEIYNPIEQARIASVLAEAISLTSASDAPPVVLDFGAGTGNLTGHLLQLGAKVIAADVSQKSLAALREKYSAANRLELIELNGIDLSNLADDSVDMVATYSVLHHVPDYLGVVGEFVRVVKPGGIIYIDHESAPCVWLEDYEGYDAYKDYSAQLLKVYGPSLSQKIVRKLTNLFSYNAWKRLVDRKFYGLNSEGDIHVFKDDHIEWDRIENILLGQCGLITRQDYLVCREMAPSAPLHKQYDGKCVDMRLMVVKKISQENTRL